MSPTNCTAYDSTTGQRVTGDAEQNELGAFLYCLVLILVYVLILGFLFVKYMRQRSTESTDIARYQLYMVASDFKQKLVLNELKERMMKRMNYSIPHLAESNPPAINFYERPLLGTITDRESQLHDLPDVMEETTSAL